MSAWHPYDDFLMPAFHERFEQRWGKGTAPFLDPTVQVHLQPLPRAQWINADTGAAIAVVPIWTGDPRHRSFGVFYLPPSGDIWVLHPGHTTYIETRQNRQRPTDHTPQRRLQKSRQPRKRIHLRHPAIACCSLAGTPVRGCPGHPRPSASPPGYARSGVNLTSSCGKPPDGSVDGQST